MRLRPDQRVVDWLVRHDAELALSSVVIAELDDGTSVDLINPWG